MISQLLVNAVIAAAIYILVGLGFALVFWNGRFFHFAHAAVYTIGAYSAYAFSSSLRTPLVISAAFGVGISGLTGAFIEWSVYRPLRRRHTSALGLLLASFGLMVALQNTLSLSFGDDTKTIRSWLNIEAGYSIFGASITLLQVSIVGSAAVLSTLLWMVLHRSKIGSSFRAVANDPELAAVHGIDPERINTWTLVIGSCLAGLAGILVGLDTNLSPTMGMRTLLFSVVAVIVGGEGRIAGVVLGGILIGLAQHMGVLFLSSAWQDGIIFLLLVVFLLVRPTGFLGRPRQGTSH